VRVIRYDGGMRGTMMSEIRYDGGMRGTMLERVVRCWINRYDVDACDKVGWWYMYN
jgi:hypothetical protein